MQAKKRLVKVLKVTFLIFGIVLSVWWLAGSDLFTGYKLQKTFGSAHFEIMNDHDEMINVIKDFISSGKLDSSPKTLINVDYHADMHSNNRHLDENYVDVGNWINVLVSEGVVDEIYWILPDETWAEEGRRDWYWEQDTAAGRTYFKAGAADQIFYLDPVSGRLFFDTPENVGLMKKVEFHKRTLSNLPNFTGGKQVMLTIDADFFDNGDMILPQSQTKKQLDKKFRAFLDRIISIGVRPVLVTCARSIDFTSKKYTAELEMFFGLIKYSTKTKQDYMSE